MHLTEVNPMIRDFLVAVAVTCLASTAVSAADFSDPTLSVSKGTVLVSNGAQFITAKPGQTLKPGDRVIVLQGAAASLKYADGHSAMLSSGTLANIGPNHGVTSSVSQKIGPMYAQAVGDSDEKGNCHDNKGQRTKCAAGLETGVNPSPSQMWAVAAFAFAAAITFASVDHNGHNNGGISGR
jgi:hypothetical protein